MAKSPEPARSDPTRRLKFLLTIAQLGLALWVVNEFSIEERRHLLAVLALAFAGFVIHCWLPLKRRMPFFLVLSLASIFLVLPWQDALMVLGLGMALIAICWLPVAAHLRIVLLLLAAGSLAYWRSGSERVFWPILGAMFMFRLIVYVFDTIGQKQRDPLPTLSYFFLLPNACFTLFPVIDYATFRRTYYDSEEFSIYQTGVHWICRGLTHLLLYRWIKYHILPMPHEIHDPADVALFLAANYALYLRVSGQFHLITGLLHLFGFNLPRTHHLFFLATSFTDIWRRINIYWKDFMQKLFFMPVFFRLRGLGTVPALLGATAGVFVATWLLHSYQTFWLLGDFPMRRNDALLWLAAGVLVAMNALWDYHRARQGAHRQDWSWTRAAVRSLQTVGMFATVSVFWGCWTYPQVFEVIASGPLTAMPAAILKDLAVFVVITIVAGVAAQWVWRQLQKQNWPARLSSFQGSVAVNVVLLLVLLAATRTDLYRSKARELAVVFETLKQDVYTPLEAAMLVRGYYEEITEAGLQSEAFSGSAGRAPPGKFKSFADMTRPTDDMIGEELIPRWRGEVSGSVLTINRWGMRDRDLPRRKPEGVYRVALLGSSVVMGYGVGDDEVFGVLLEKHLNAAQAPGSSKIELLNFGTGRCFPIQRRLILGNKALAFEPDAVLYFAHQDEFSEPARHLAGIWAEKFDVADPCLEGIIRRAGLKADAAFHMAQAALMPHTAEIVECTYQRIVADCRGRGIAAGWIYLPMPGVTDAPDFSAQLMQLAGGAGFVVAEISDWAVGYTPAQVKLGAEDHHANVLGHRLIAESLFEKIHQQPELLPGFVPKNP